MPLAFTDRVLLAAIQNRQLEGLALAALRRAVSLLGLAIGTRIGELRNSEDRFLAAAGKLEEQALLVRLHEELRDIVAARWDKVPCRQRPHYTPEQRYRILRLKQLLALSRADIAHLVRVDENTIANWEQEATTAPDLTDHRQDREARATGRRFADVVRGVVQAMGVAGFGGHDVIARTLARAGWKLSKRTVGRVRREKPIVPTGPRSPEPAPRLLDRHGPPAQSRPHDGHHRGPRSLPYRPLPPHGRARCLLADAARGPRHRNEPTATQVLEVAQAANLSHGSQPLITDEGRQFTSELFRRGCAATSTKQRFGAIGNTGSIAIIERVWRTIKDLGHLRADPPLTLDDLRRRAELTLQHYAYCRSHRALGGATPAEIYFDIEPAHLTAVHPPRAKPGEGPTDAPFEIAYLDHEHRLALLRPKVA